MLGKAENWQQPSATTELPFVSIIVPARNEENNIEACVKSLLAQDYPNFEVIAVDDNSEDATGTILERLARRDTRLKLLHLKELPEGWAGKPHAMQMGSEAISPNSSWLLFTDADTYHQPQALRLAIASALANNTDLFSILPKMNLVSFWERVLMPLAVLGISLQYPLDEVNSPDSKLAVANGQFLLMRRTMYDKVGGYAGKLRNSLLDDRDMALAVKEAKGRIYLTNGRSLMQVRMYTNLSEIWRGWRKNVFVGSRSAYLLVPFFVIVLLLNGVMPILQLLYALLKLPGAKSPQRYRRLALLSFGQLAVQAISQYRLDKVMQVPKRYALTTPLAALIFSGILLDSMRSSLSGRGVSWKGRNYSQAAKTQQLIK